MGSRLRRTLLTLLGVIGLLFVPIAFSYGQSVTYLYDDLNRLARIDYGDGIVIDYTYDEVGNRLTENIHQLILPTTTASPAGGVYNSAQPVTLTCRDPGGPGCDKIYYTTDGTTPTTSSPIYSSPITITATTTLKFFAKDLSGLSERVKTQAYTFAVVGDLNGDGKVDCTDLAIVKASFGKKSDQAGFDPRADLNRDGVVDIRDLATVARQVPAGTRCQ